MPSGGDARGLVAARQYRMFTEFFCTHEHAAVAGTSELSVVEWKLARILRARRGRGSLSILPGLCLQHSRPIRLEIRPAGMLGEG